MNSIIVWLLISYAQVYDNRGSMEPLAQYESKDECVVYKKYLESNTSSTKFFCIQSRQFYEKGTK